MVIFTEISQLALLLSTTRAVYYTAAVLFCIGALVAGLVPHFIVAPTSIEASNI